MRFILAYILFFLSSVGAAPTKDAQIKDEARTYSFSPYQINTQDGEWVENTFIGSKRVLRVGTQSGELTFIYKDDVIPHSIRTIKQAIQKLQGDEKSLAHKRFGDSTLFYFMAPDAAYIFSTLGGMFIVIGPAEHIEFKDLTNSRMRLVE